MDIQTDEDIEEQIKKRQEDQDTGTVWAISSTDGTYEGFKKVKQMTWQIQAYRRVKEQKGNPIAFASTTDLAIFTWLEMKRGIARIFKERYPDIDEVGPEDLLESGVIHLTQTSRVTIRGEEKVKERFVFRAVVDTGEGGPERFVFTALKKLKDSAVKNSCVKFALPIPEELDQQTALKMVDYIFGDSTVNVTMHIPNSMKKILKEEETEPKAKRNRAAETETLLIKAKGTSYADLLREVKEKVDINGINVTVKSIKKTKNGDLLKDQWQI
ncbi:unnamed protein product [Psylliodes chrysocephalus]|uniref:Uncharacterized protein n=1 Tax=Psylliodes chrysocephalus TaxID=3402493 RepID=A0A9P0GDY3_9CUCU|nr:unnamed protein product [Psylliodes chrysocephala]